jgi:hypothetical protein
MSAAADQTPTQNNHDIRNIKRSRAGGLSRMEVNAIGRGKVAGVRKD